MSCCGRRPDSGIPLTMPLEKRTKVVFLMERSARITPMPILFHLSERPASSQASLQDGGAANHPNGFAIAKACCSNSSQLANSELRSLPSESGRKARDAYGCRGRDGFGKETLRVLVAICARICHDFDIGAWPAAFRKQPLAQRLQDCAVVSRFSEQPGC